MTSTHQFTFAGCMYDCSDTDYFTATQCKLIESKYWGYLQIRINDDLRISTYPSTCYKKCQPSNCTVIQSLPNNSPTILIKVLELTSRNYLLKVFLYVLHCLGAEMLAVVNTSKAENANTVGVIKLLFHVASTSLKH